MEIENVINSLHQLTNIIDKYFLKIYFKKLYQKLDSIVFNPYKNSSYKLYYSNEIVIKNKKR